MSQSLQSQAIPAVDKLISLDEEDLFSELGRRVVAMREEPTRTASFDFQPSPFESFGDASSIGHKFFDNLNQAAYDACCGDGDSHKEIEKVFDQGTTALATAIAAVLVSHLAIAAAVATAFAVIVVKIVAKAAGKTMCEAWKENLPAEKA
jgi:hypothetical protein